MKRKAFITGIGGQTGSYLAELLLKRDYKVYGLIRRNSMNNTINIKHILDDIEIVSGDMSDFYSLFNAIKTIQPDEVYNLAAQSDVRVSFDQPTYTNDVNYFGVLRLLESIRSLDMMNKIKFYQASTSEMFGGITNVIQNENTPFHPQSPYGISKLAAHHLVKNYRKAYDMYACAGILYNHDGSRRGENFVTRKVTLGIARIVHGVQDKIYLGNLDAYRDWGHAQDYANAIYLMLQQDKADDFVIATGETYKVRTFVEKAFRYAGFQDFEWQGAGENEKGVCLKTGKVFIEIDTSLYRPSEVPFLKGDASKARKVLGFEPKYNLDRLIKEMVDNDIKLIQRSGEKRHEKD